MGLLLRATMLLLGSHGGDAQICLGSTAHSMCPIGNYCDGSAGTSGNCFTCTFITPDNCDALAIVRQK